MARWRAFVLIATGCSGGVTGLKANLTSSKASKEALVGEMQLHSTVNRTEFPGLLGAASLVSSANAISNVAVSAQQLMDMAKVMQTVMPSETSTENAQAGNGFNWLHSPTLMAAGKAMKGAGEMAKAMNPTMHMRKQARHSQEPGESDDFELGKDADETASDEEEAPERELDFSELWNLGTEEANPEQQEETSFDDLWNLGEEEGSSNGVSNAKSKTPFGIGGGDMVDRILSKPRQKAISKGILDGTRKMFQTAGAANAKVKGMVDTAQNLVSANLQKGKEQMRQKSVAFARNIGEKTAMVTGWNKELCKGSPELCQAPFFCQNPPSYEEKMNARIRIATPDGHPNFREWCRFPELTEVVKHCLLKQDFDTTAMMTYQLAVQGNNDEVEASRCFMEGHCMDTTVDRQTWASKGEELCTKQYGEAWKDVPQSADRILQYKEDGLIDSEEGIKDPAISQLLGMVSCAHGSFHCDVYTCKATYCQQEYYIQKFGHLSPSF